MTELRKDSYIIFSENGNLYSGTILEVNHKNVIILLQNGDKRRFPIKNIKNETKYHPAPKTEKIPEKSNVPR